MKSGDLVRITLYPMYDPEIIVGLVLGITLDTEYTRYVKILTGGITKVFCVYREEDKVEVIS